MVGGWSVGGGVGQEMLGTGNFQTVAWGHCVRAVSCSLLTMAGQVNKRMLYVGGIADEVDVQVRPRPRILLACDSDSKLGTTQSFVSL
jgi:hypothetical protein